MLLALIIAWFCVGVGGTIWFMKQEFGEFETMDSLLCLLTGALGPLMLILAVIRKIRGV